MLLLAKTRREIGKVEERRTLERRTRERRAPERRTRERRTQERRWRDASFYLVERREEGNLRKYGALVLCVALWAVVGWLTL